MAAVIATTSFAVAATPAAVPGDGSDPLGRIVDSITHSAPITELAHALHSAVAPQSAQAYCASNATFTGWLTATGSSHTAVTRVKGPGVYAYISKVNTPFSCTAFYRYSGVAWNTTASGGRFDYGNLIKSTSVSCNFVVNSNDYVKANWTTDCPDTDSEYALLISLGAERHYTQGPHTTVGATTFVHSSCSTYYENGTDTGEKVVGGEPGSEQDFTGGNVNNRPGANCAAMTVDGFGASPQVDIWYDKTAPTLSFSAPAGSPTTVTGTSSTAYTVNFGTTDAVSGFGTGHGWTLARQIGSNTGTGTCSNWAPDTATGSVVTGTTNSASQTNAQTLLPGQCYQWILTGSDMNGNATSQSSAILIVDTVNPSVSFLSPFAPLQPTDTTLTRNATSYSVSWLEGDGGSGINTRSLQRYKAASTTPSCTSLTYTTDGAANTGTSPQAQTLTANNCYHWIQTLTDKANRSTSCTSGDIWVSPTGTSAYPQASFTTPADGSLTYQTSSSYSVAWTEAAGTGSITSRQLWRQKAANSLLSCQSVGWANDSTETPTPVPYTSGSPRSSTFATDGLYRWVQTLTNSAGKTGKSASGWLVVDTAPPTGSMTSPVANAALSGTVTITGTANDTGSFKDYVLEYGSGPSPSTWLPIGTYTVPVTSAGTLGTWSPGTLSGVYTIRLTVHENASTSTYTTSRTVVLENTGRGTETYRTRVPYDLAGAWTLDVGVANGEARLARDLFSIPSYGPSQALSLTYSSATATDLTASAGRFGAGWSSNLTQYLTFDVANAITTWHRSDGGIVPFGLLGSTWTPPKGHFETLSVSGTEVTVTTRDQTKYVFDSTAPGRLKRIENRFGKALTLAWNMTSATATDASPRPTAIAIDSTNDRITSVTDSAGRAWTFGYTGTGTSSDLTCITDPASKVMRLGYTAHQLTSVSRGGATCAVNGTATWTVAYTANKATSVKDPLQTHPDLFTYAADATTASNLTDDSGSGQYADTGYHFDTANLVAGRGLVDQVTDPSGVTTTRTRDADGNVTRETVPAGAANAQTDWTYDSHGNVTSETRHIDPGVDPNDPADDVVVVTAYTYNATNDLLSRTDADNDDGLRLVTKYTYDGSGHLTSENRDCTSSLTTLLPQGQGGTCTGAGTQDTEFNIITNYAYTPKDQLEFEQDPLGRVTKHVYDTDGNELSVIANCTSTGTTQPSPFNTCTGSGTADAQTNVVTSSAYAPTDTDGKAGLPTTSTDALGRVASYDYDALGRLLTTVLPGDASVAVLTKSIAYDEYGDALTEIDSWTPSGGSLQTRTTTHTYDALGREVQVLDPELVKTLTTYDVAGNDVKTQVDDPSSSNDVTTIRSFDGNLRIKSEVAGSLDDGQETGFDYSSLGVVTKISQALQPPPGGDEVTLSKTSVTDLRGLVTSESVSSGGATPLTTTTTYDKLGNELSVDDPNPNPSGGDSDTTYDHLGRVKTTTVDNRITSYTYDRVGNQLTVTDPAGIKTTTSYDPLNRATVVVANDVASPTLPTEDVTTRTYFDAAGNAVATQDPAGITTRTILNVRDQAVTTIADCTDSGTTPTGNPAACTGAGTHNDTANVVTQRVYDAQGNVTMETAAVGRPAEAITETAYDKAGKVVATKDPLGMITHNAYNPAGQLTDTYVNCTHVGTTIPTDWAGCDGAGTADGTYNRHTGYTYDDEGRQTMVTAPNGRKTLSVYDDGGNLAQTIDNYVDGVPGTTDDITTERFYDAYGRLAAVRTPTPTGSAAATTVTRTTYNSDGTIASEIRNCTDTTDVNHTPPDPAACAGTAVATAEWNLTTSYGYDTRGNRVVVTTPDPSATSGSSTATVTMQYAFDAANRLCRVVENATGSTNLQGLSNPCADATQTAGTATTNLSTKYAYDGAGNQTSMVDAAGHTTTYSFDALNHPTGKTDADSGVLVWAYDALGNRISQRNRTDSPPTLSVTWTYDPFGRILTRTADSVTTTYSYDKNGNKLTASDGTYTITAAYDGLGRVATVDDEDVGTTPDTTYTYGVVSSPPYLLLKPTWTDPSGSYTATLDAFDRQTVLDEPADAGTSDLTWAFGPSGQVSTMTWPNGNMTQYLYDHAGHLTSKTTAAGATNRAVYGWAYNRAGQVLTENENVTGGASNGTVTYAYDALGQLTGSTLSGTTTSYGWDKVPNRTSVQVGAGTPATTTYDAADRPTSGANPTAAYSSNAEGMLTARPGQTLIWDHLGRLKQVKDAAGTTVLATYTYDPLDRLRTAADTAGNRVRFRYTGMTTQVAQWLDDVAGTVTRNVGSDWTGERLLDWTTTAGTQRYYGTNAHHDVTWLSGTSGTVSQALRYDPFGNARTTAPSGYTPFRFQSSWYDPNSDLSWVITRWYAPAMGRFVSEDSLLGQSADPDSRHLYAYGAGDPVGRWDPWGTDDWWRQDVHSGCVPQWVADLNCSRADFDQMNSLERLRWLHAFQTTFAKGGWFNAIEGVLLGSQENNVIRPSQSWFSKVDSYILSAIQDGKRLQLKWSALVPANPGNAIWKQFFEAYRRGSSSSLLRYYWGRAEQAATDYGVLRSHDRSPTRQEWNAKSVTDIWRFAVSFLDVVGIAGKLVLGSGVYSWVHDNLLDPRMPSDQMQRLFTVVWRGIGAGVFMCQIILKTGQGYPIC